MDRAWFMANLWRWAAGVPELDSPPVHRYTRKQALGDWSEQFIQLMRNRMVLGIYRYGSYKSPQAPNYDRIGSVLKRLRLYGDTGNQEFLVDSANLLMIEFDVGDHPNKHFCAIDDGYHTEIKS